jgi:hypothetical protein
MGVRGLAVEPRMPIGIMEREVALAPVLIVKVADLHTEPF